MYVTVQRIRTHVWHREGEGRERRERRERPPAIHHHKTVTCNTTRSYMSTKPLQATLYNRERHQNTTITALKHPFRSAAGSISRSLPPLPPLLHLPPLLALTLSLFSSPSAHESGATQNTTHRGGTQYKRHEEEGDGEQLIEHFFFVLPPVTSHGAILRSSPVRHVHLERLQPGLVVMYSCILIII